MKANFLSTITISIIIGLLIANGYMVFSGLPTVLISLYFLTILTLVISAIVLIIREPIRKFKIILLGILIVAITLGILIDNIRIKAIVSNTTPPRIYYQEKIE